MYRVDNALNSIKGGGACQLREKVLAEAADTWVIVADYRKNSEVLGTTVRTLPSCFRPDKTKLTSCLSFHFYFLFYRLLSDDPGLNRLSS